MRKDLKEICFSVLIKEIIWWIKKEKCAWWNLLRLDWRLMVLTVYVRAKAFLWHITVDRWSWLSLCPGAGVNLCLFVLPICFSLIQFQFNGLERCWSQQRCYWTSKNEIAIIILRLPKTGWKWKWWKTFNYIKKWVTDSRFMISDNIGLDLFSFWVML